MNNASNYNNAFSIQPFGGGQVGGFFNLSWGRGELYVKFFFHIKIYRYLVERHFQPYLDDGN